MTFLYIIVGFCILCMIIAAVDLYKTVRKTPAQPLHRYHVKVVCHEYIEACDEEEALEIAKDHARASWGHDDYSDVECRVTLIKEEGD